MQLSKTVRAKQIKRERESQGLPVFDGGLGENPSPPPKQIIDSFARHANKNSYENAMGIEELKNILGSRIVLGNGLKPLLATVQLAFMKSNPHGIIVHIVPMWLSYREQTKLLQLPVANIIPKSRDYRVTAEDIRETLKSLSGRPHLILFNSPNNPTGYVYSLSEVREFASVFREYDSTVLFDSIYEHIIHPYEIFCDLALHYPKTITGSSLSKNISCGGYRLGWLKFPRELVDLWGKCLEIASMSYTCPTTALQYVAVDYLKGDFETYYTNQSKMFGEVTEKCAVELQRMGLWTSKPQGAYYLLVDFAAYAIELISKKILTSDDLSDYLCEELGFITIPGSVFGINEPYIVRYSVVDIKDIDHEIGIFNDEKIDDLIDTLLAWILKIQSDYVEES